MEEIAKNLKEKIEAFKAELDKNVAGNKAAGGRARKLSSELTTLLKEYRKVSVAEAKK